MQCPKCEEGALRKIKLQQTDKVGFLCDNCQTLWWEDEHISSTTGHTLSAKEQTVPESFVYLSEKDKEEMQIKDEENREDYKFYKGGEI